MYLHLVFSFFVPFPSFYAYSFRQWNFHLYILICTQITSRVIMNVSWFLEIVSICFFIFSFKIASVDNTRKIFSCWQSKAYVNREIWGIHLKFNVMDISMMKPLTFNLFFFFFMILLYTLFHNLFYIQCLVLKLINCYTIYTKISRLLCLHLF